MEWVWVGPGGEHACAYNSSSHVAHPQLSLHFCLIPSLPLSLSLSLSLSPSLSLSLPLPPPPAPHPTPPHPPSQEYAVELAARPEVLANMRQLLREHRSKSPVFSTKAWTQGLVSVCLSVFLFTCLFMCACVRDFNEIGCDFLIPLLHTTRNRERARVRERARLKGGNGEGAVRRSDCLAGGRTPLCYPSNNSVPTEGR